MTGPAKIGHVSLQNSTTFQTFVTHNFLLQYGMVTQFSEIVHNLTGFPTHLTEPKYYISVLRYVSSNNMVYFSPHALFLQARSHIIKHNVLKPKCCITTYNHSIKWHIFPPQQSLLVFWLFSAVPISCSNLFFLLF